jgi:trk system potassium uptake protein TrkA
MHVIIGGCGRVGAAVADQMANEGHDVVLLDTREEAFYRLGTAFNGETLIGDITDKDVLQRARIEMADAFVAVTALDNANLMSVQIAKELFDVPHTVARLFNPERESSYRKMRVHYVSGTRLVAKAILNEVRAGAFPQHVSFRESDVEIVEMRVHEGGAGKTVDDLEGLGDVRVAAIQRDFGVRLPSGDEQLRAGDVVVAACRRSAYEALHELVAHPFDDEA